MKKQDIKSIVAEYFKNNPEASECFTTKDGNAFHKKGDAFNHIRDIRSEEKPEQHKRGSEEVKTVAPKAKPAKKATVDENDTANRGAVVEEPKAEEPAVEEPKAEEPKAEEPASEEDKNPKEGAELSESAPQTEEPAKAQAPEVESQEVETPSEAKTNEESSEEATAPVAEEETQVAPESPAAKPKPKAKKKAASKAKK